MNLLPVGAMTVIRASQILRHHSILRKMSRIGNLGLEIRSIAVELDPGAGTDLVAKSFGDTHSL